MSIRWFFSDSQGRRVIFQPPNAIIILWFTLWVINSLIFKGEQTILRFYSDAALFTWAYMELRQGESPFRKVLGALVLVGLVLMKVTHG